jgi:hypothetical protein
VRALAIIVLALSGCYDFSIFDLVDFASNTSVDAGADSKELADTAAGDFGSTASTDAEVTADLIAPDLTPACVEGAACGAADCTKFNGTERAYKHTCKMGVCVTVSTLCGNGCCGSVCC